MHRVGAAALACAVTLLACLAPTHAGNATADECRALGFSGLALCSDCDSFSTIVHDAELAADCNRCCVEETKDTGVIYDKAVLEVCPWHLQGLPMLREFIDKHSKSFPEVSVKQMPGRPPTLKLRTKDGSQREEVRVDAWKTEHVLDFLKSKLKVAAPTDVKK